MSAWGIDCGTWDDSVDMANLEAFDFGEIPEDSFVVTTWHEGLSLLETMWFLKFSATHPSVSLNKTVIIHIGGQSKETELVGQFDNLQQIDTSS